MVVETYTLRIGRRKVGKSEGSDMSPYTESDSETDRGMTAANISRVVRGNGSAYTAAREELDWIAE